MASERTVVETETGYIAHLTTTAAIDGVVLVKASTVFKGFNTPAIVLKEFTGDDAMARGVFYMETLKKALLGEIEPPKSTRAKAGE